MARVGRASISSCVGAATVRLGLLLLLHPRRLMSFCNGMMMVMVVAVPKSIVTMQLLVLLTILMMMVMGRMMLRVVAVAMTARAED